VTISNRAKRILVYTISLLIAPMFVMPHEPGTRNFVISLIPCGVILTLSSWYVLRGETKKPQGLLGKKLFVTSFITLLFAAGLVAGSIVYLVR